MVMEGAAMGDASVPPLRSAPTRAGPAMARVGPVDSDPQPPDRPVDLTADDPLAALQRWVADGQVDEAARARSRRRWLENIATEEATLGGVLLDLAERGRPVIVRTLAGHRVTGPIIAVGADFIGIRDPRLGDTLMPTTRIATVQPAPGDDLPAGDRRHDVVLAFGDALMELAAERPEVMVGVGDETLRGELRTASSEVVTLVIADERREPISIALTAIDHVVVRFSLTTSLSFDEIAADAPGIDTRRSGRRRGTG